MFALWRFGYPLTQAAIFAPFTALLLVGAGIYSRRIRLTKVLRDGIFQPESRYKGWFRGPITGLAIAAMQGSAIVLAISHFALRAQLPELLLATGIGIFTLAAIAGLRHIMARELKPEFAVTASAWMAAAIALPFCIMHFWMQKNILTPPAYLDETGFVNVLQASLRDLPQRRDYMIEALSAMQLLEAAINWMLHSLNDLWGTSALLFLYNAGICLAVGRFFADIAATFNICGLHNDGETRQA